MSNRKLIIKYIFILCISLSIISCSDNNENSNNNPDTNTSPEPADPNLSTETLLFNFGLLVQAESPDDDGLSITIPFLEQKTLPISLKPNGSISIKARDFPRYVLRLCKLGSQIDNCTQESSQVPTDLDLVLDLCGFEEPDENCGRDGGDNTLSLGKINDDGSVSLLQVPFRLRLFAVTDQLDGFTAEDTDLGLSESDRIPVNLVTGTSSTSLLAGSGSRLNENILHLVGTGYSNSGDGNPLQDAHLLFSLIGQLNKNPFDFMNQ